MHGHLPVLFILAAVIGLTAGTLAALRKRRTQIPAGLRSWSSRDAGLVSGLVMVAHSDLSRAGHHMTWAFADDGGSNTGVCTRCGRSMTVTATSTGGARADYGDGSCGGMGLGAPAGGLVRCPG